MISKRMASFLAIGAMATGLQYLILIVLTGQYGVDAVVASVIGYVTSAMFNYYLNYSLTFKSDKRHVEAFSKFVVVAGVGMVWNAALMGLLVHGLGLAYLLAQVAATGVVLIWNYFANRYWTFG